ncbi:MAG: hypothetical protein WCB55_25770 [Pseudolabrys sp.]
MGKKIRLSGPLVTARHSRAQEATVAHIIRSVYTLMLARNEKPAVITLKSTFAGAQNKLCRVCLHPHDRRSARMMFL